MCNTGFCDDPSDPCIECGAESTMDAGVQGGPMTAYCDDHGPDWMGYADDYDDHDFINDDLHYAAKEGNR